MYMYFQGNWESNSAILLFLPVFSIGVNSKRTESAPRRADSFLKELTPFEGYVFQGSQ